MSKATHFNVLLMCHRCLFLADENECLRDKNVCGFGAVCENVRGSYLCQCQDGYYYDGKSCQGKFISFYISVHTHTVMFLFHWKIRFTVFWTRCLSYLAIHVNTISAAIFCLESSVKAMHNPFNNIFHSSVLGYQLVNLRKSMKSKSFADCLVRHTLKNPIDFPLLMYYW